MGGNLIHYDGDVSTKMADPLTTVKCMINSVVSTPNGRFMADDLKDFYLDYKYEHISVHMIPTHIIDLYQLRDKIVDGHVYAEACKEAMYGRPQAGKLANDRLQKYLAPLGYEPCAHTHGLWRRDTNSDLIFTLVVDDFGVRYTNKADATKLMPDLKLNTTKSLKIGPARATWA
jgi:hypothetical protein